MLAIVIVISMTVIVTAPIMGIVVFLLLYGLLVHPAKRQAKQYYEQLQEIATILADERRLRTDLLKWIELECSASKAPKIFVAIKQRIKEREEVLRQLHLQRQRLR